jgi:hypothetical protein
MHLHVARSLAFSATVSSPILIGSTVVCSSDDLALRRREARQQRVVRNREVACPACPRGAPAPSKDIAA